MLDNLKVSFFLAYKSLRRGNLGTVLLTITIMSLIFVNLVFLPSMISGIGETFYQQSIDYLFGHIIIEPKGDDIYIGDVDKIQNKINRLPGVTESSTHYITGATFTYKNNFVSGSLYSINPLDEVRVTKIHEKMIRGEYLTRIDTNEILLGIDLAGEEGEIMADPRANLGGAKVGDKVIVTFSNGVIKEYRVKGIFDTGYMYVDGYAYITEKEMESILGVDNKASEIIVRLNERGNEKEFKKMIMSFGVNEEVKTWNEKLSGFVEDVVGSFDLIKLISTIVSLIIAVVVIFIVIYINTINKRKQIGILKAVGIDQQIIINSYVIQSGFYCICGIIIGSFILSFLISYFMARPIPFPIGQVKPLVEKRLIIRSIFSLILVSLFAGFVPSWKTAKEDILKSIWG